MLHLFGMLCKDSGSCTWASEIGLPFSSMMIEHKLFIGKFHLSKSNSEMTFPTAFSYCPAMQWTMFSEGSEPEENQIDCSDFLPLQSHGRKGESAPMMHCLVTPTELCSLFAS